MNILHEQHSITASEGEEIFLDVRLPELSKALPIVVVAHGFKGFKDWGFFPYACESLAKNGFYVVNFNFSHNGTEGHGSDFTRLDRFARNTFSREIRELREVIDAVTEGRTPYAERADAENLQTIGHSRGGGIALLQGAADSRVKRISTWAAVSTFKRYTDSQQKRWHNDGYIEVPNARTGQIMRLNVELLEELELNSDAFSVTKAAAQFHRPLLILHGEVDLSVEIVNGERLHQASRDNLTEFVRIPKTGHTFGIVHPFEGTTEAFETVLEKTSGFFKASH